MTEGASPLKALEGLVLIRVWVYMAALGARAQPPA